VFSNEKLNIISQFVKQSDKKVVDDKYWYSLTKRSEVITTFLTEEQIVDYENLYRVKLPVLLRDVLNRCVGDFIKH
jgi:hypothetical protein